MKNIVTFSFETLILNVHYNFETMEGDDINPVVLEQMKKNGAFLKLYSLFLAKISQEGQNSDILVLQPYKKVKLQEPYELAAAIVVKYLNNHKFTNTLTSVKAEFRNADVYSNPNPQLEDKLRLPKNNSPIKTMIKIWSQDISTPFYNNRDRLSDIIREKYQRLSITDNSTKTPKTKKEPSPSKVTKGRDPPPIKPINPKPQIDESKPPKQSKKLPLPPKEIEQSYTTYDSQDTESIEPWQPSIGMQRAPQMNKGLQLPKPKQAFQFKPIQIKDSDEF